MQGHVVVIDRSLPHTADLLAALPDQAPVIWIDPRDDGLSRLATQLEQLASPCTVLHLLSHGAPGLFHLGASVIDTAQLASHATSLARIAARLGDEAEVRVYGCETGAGAAGAAFVDALAAALGAPVCAATRVIGLTPSGPWWQLDAGSGRRGSTPALAFDAYPASLGTIPGTPGADVLTSAPGVDDTLIGGLGNDTYVVNDVGDVVVEAVGEGTDQVNVSLAAYTLGANIENGRILSVGAANLTGNTGANVLFAGAGDNIIDGGAGLDTVSYAFATAAVTVNLGLTVAQATGGSGSDTLIGIENVNGSNFADTLTGNAAANAINGGLLADTMIGGDGSDTYTVDNIGDVVTETNALAAGGIDQVNESLAAYTLGANVENGRILSIGAANITGNALANTLFAGAGANVIDGGAGLDTVSYAVATGAVTVDLSLVGAQATLGSGSDTLVSIENLTGSNFADTLTGNAAANAINGGLLADIMIGGDGSDTYTVDNVGDVVTETNALAAGGTDQVSSLLAAYTLGANVENGRILSAVGGNLTGNTLANTLIAGAGANVLDGGAGLDTASYAVATAAVTVSLAVVGAQVTGGSGSDTLVAIENLTGSNFADTLTGNAAANAISGGVGADTMTGGDGADTYDVDNLGDVVTETNALAAGGTDLVNSRLVAYTLGANVENGRILSTVAANLSGNTLANTLYAGTGNNVLDGGAGLDTASYALAAAAVTVSLAVVGAQATGGSGSDTLVGIENLTGSNFADTLTGNAAANAINGGLGADLMTGGDGSDTYTVDNLGDLVTETNALAAGGIDQVNESLVAYTLGANVENGRILSAAAANLTGNALANTLFAGAGANVLDGGAGTDTVSYALATAAVTVNLALLGAQVTGGSGSDTLVSIENLTGSNFADTLTGNAAANALSGGLLADLMIGGDGNDTYTVDNVGDIVSETNALSAGGIDQVNESLATYTLGANVENGRILSTGVANLTGNTLANVLFAAAGANVLDGAGGVDTASYALATAAVTVNLAAVGAQATGGSGSDTLIAIENLTGSNLADTLTGNAGANLLTGGLGNDTINGGAGQDTLIGSAGNDALDGGAILDRVNYTDLNVVTYAGTATGVSVDLQAGTASDGLGGTDTLSNLNSVIGTSFNDTFTGSSTDNLFEQFEGGLGNDTIDGGAINLVTGNNGNRAVYSSAAAAVAVNLALGTATGGAGTDTLININQVRGSAFADTLLGSNTTAWTEQFEGRQGNDTINGLGGNDLVRYDAATVSVYVNLATGVASDGQGSTDTLFNIEGIRGSNFNDVLTGGNIANGTGATDGFEFFIGNAGNDTINGGGGFDRVDYNTSTSGVTVTLNFNGVGTASDGLGGTDTLIDIEAVRGSAFGDKLTGSNTAGALNGQDFESFEGREGNDTIDGQGGTDRVDYTNVAGAVVVNLATGTASDGFGGTDTLLNIEGVRGSNFDDLLVGGAVANGVGATDGFEFFIGGAGNDTINGGAGYDRVDYVFNSAGVAVTLSYNGQGTASDGQGGTDTLIDIEAVRGSIFNDTLTGSDTSLAVSGENFESFEGNGGNDTINGGGGFDRADYQFSSAGIDVDLLAGTAADGLGFVDQLSNIEGIRGSAFDDNIVGSALGNTLQGMAGDDVIDGGDGNDSIDGGAGTDVLVGGLGDDTLVSGLTGEDYDALTGGAGNDRLDGTGGRTVAVYDVATSGVQVNLATGTAQDGQGGTDTLVGIATVQGSSFADVLTGAASNDFFIGGGGNDTMDGAAGFDMAGYDTTDVLGGVTIDLSLGTASGLGVGTDVLLNFEAVEGSSFDDNIVGTAQANILDGWRGNDTIDGGDGNDTLSGNYGTDLLIGGLGVDRVQYTDTFQAISVSLATGVAVDGKGTVDTLIGIEDIEGSAFNDTISGDGQANTLLGRDGNDSLSGAAGNDTLQGGAGGDTLIGGEGNDSMDGGVITDLINYTDLNFLSYASATSSTVINLETGTASDGLGGTDTLLNMNFVLGSAFNDSMTGSSGIYVEQFEGGLGDDTIDGGAINLITFANNNRVNYGRATGAVSVDLSLGQATGAAGNDTLININIVFGSNFGDTLTGSNSAVLTEQFDGRVGNDTIDGQGGIDFVRYDGASSAVAVDLANGVALDGLGDTDTLLNIEGIRGSIFGDSLIGGNVANGVGATDGLEIFIGNAGNDTIDGGEGYDRADYTTSTSGVTVTMSYNGTGQAFDGLGGTDDLINIEAVRGSAFADSLTGSDTSLAIPAENFESFEGREGNDVINGLGGFDRADYTSTTGAIVANLATGTVSDGYGGTDALINIEAVRGGAFNDLITGSANAERFTGNGGNDTLTGGLGLDTFVFEAALNASTNVDTITDFAAGEKIWLDNDVFTALGGPAALGTAQFFSGAGLTGSTSAAQGAGIYYDSGTGSLYYDPDGFGGAAAIKFAVLSGAPGVTAGNFEVRE